MAVAANFPCACPCIPVDCAPVQSSQPCNANYPLPVCHTQYGQTVPLDWFCCEEIRILICAAKIQARNMRLKMYDMKSKSINQNFACLECQILLMEMLCRVLEQGGSMSEKARNELVSKLMGMKETWGCV